VNINKLHNHLFHNDVLRYESFLHEFNSSIFNELDGFSKKIGLAKKITDLIEGEKVNLSENRAAFHPKYRNNFEPFKFNSTLNNIKNIVNIGIGGSYEGPKLLVESFHTNKSYNHIFITGSDNFEFDFKIKGLKPTETVFIISSKSFKTDETLNIFHKALRWSGDIKKFTAITANKKLASEYGIKNIYEFDIEIGGRYSIWSPIFLPAQLGSSNFDPIKFIEGGRQVDIDITENKDFIKFVKTLSFSDIWYGNYGRRYVRAVLTYNWKLRSFPNYVQQLEMESLGKNKNAQSKFKNTGQIIFGGYGPVAQHSYFQLLHQGTQKICADIIVSEEEKDLSYAQAVTQSKLLSRGAEDLKKENKINGNTPVNFFRLNKIDSYNLGYLIATWEYRTFITATILNINPFDQYGVNAGKIYTKKYLSEKD